MTQADVNKKLAQTKLALAEKYENRARLAGSAAKRKKFLHDATRARRFAAQLEGK